MNIELNSRCTDLNCRIFQELLMIWENIYNMIEAVDSLVS